MSFFQGLQIQTDILIHTLDVNGWTDMGATLFMSKQFLPCGSACSRSNYCDLEISHWLHQLVFTLTQGSPFSQSRRGTAGISMLSLHWVKAQQMSRPPTLTSIYCHLSTGELHGIREPRWCLWKPWLVDGVKATSLWISFPHTYPALYTHPRDQQIGC